MISCSTASKEKLYNNDTIKLVDTQLKVKSMDYIHTFKNNDGGVLAKLYGTSVDKGVFSDLLIVMVEGNEIIPVYAIEKTKFRNALGEENFQVKELGFYGYRISVKSDNYVTLEIFWNDSKNSSGADPVTIEWNTAKKLFEMLRTP